MNQGADSDCAKTLWNKAQSDYPKDRSIPDLFSDQVQCFPDKIAICHGTRKITYRQLNQFANQVANYLLNHGVCREQLIVVAMNRSVEFIIAILGILKAGAAYLPMDSHYPSARIDYMLQDSAAVLVFVSSVEDKKRISCQQQIVSLDEIIQQTNQSNGADNAIQVETHATNLAHVIYTSGTTGKPKGIEILHRGVVRLVKNTNYIKIDSTDRIAHLANVAFDAATFEIWGALLNGAEIVIVDQDLLLSPAAFEKIIKRYKISIAFLTTAYFHKLAVQNPRIFADLQYLLIGGETVNPKIVKHLFTAHAVPRHFIHVYGPTEVTVYAVYHEIVAQDCEQKTIPIGQAISNTCTLVFTEDQQLAPIGAVGELYLGGDGLARGYRNKLQLTQESFIQNPLAGSEMNRLYKTGDLVRCLPNGELEFMGRYDQQIKLHGFRVELREIEYNLCSHPDVLQACATLLEVDGSQQLVAYVILYSARKLMIHSLHEHLKKHLPQYMLPAAYVEVSTIPITENGKIAYAALPTPAVENYVLLSKHQRASTEQQQKIAKIWSNALHIPVDEISIDDKFFDIGGHSLLTMQILLDISSAFNVSVKFSEFLAHSSIAQLDCLIRNKREYGHSMNDQALTIKSVDRGQPNLASLYQKRLWFVQHYDPQSVTYNVNKLFYINGKINIPVLELAISALVKKHEILRTNFYMEENLLLQKVHPWQEHYSYLTYRDLCEDRFKDGREIIEAAIHQPFNLQSDRLFRVILFREADEQYQLLFFLHHIIIDGYSFKLLFDDLNKFYQIFLSSRAVEYVPMKIQFIDYAAWQHRDLSAHKREKILHYWQKKLRDLPVLDIQLGRRRPPIQSHRGAYYYFSIPETLLVRITELAHRLGVSLSNILFSAYSLLLAKYSRQQDLVIGIPVMHRPQQCLNQLIGFFINTLPLRIDLFCNPTGSEFLQNNHELLNEALDHQEVPFDEILNHLKLSVDPSRHPIFQALFSFNQFQHNNLQLANVQVHAEAIHTNTAKVDIELVIDAGHNEAGHSELIGHFEYAVDLLDASTIQRMSQHYLTLLQEICDAPHQRVNQFNLLTLPERQQILYDWNDTADVDEALQSRSSWTSLYHGPEQLQIKNNALHHLFEEQVVRSPQHIALTDHGQQLTYQELNQRANQLAHYLQNKGVKPGDFVAVCLARSITMMIAILGVLKSGAAYVPIDPELPNNRIQFMLKDSGVRYVLIDNSMQVRADHWSQGIINLDLMTDILQRESSINPSFKSKSNAIAYMIYTSGTTGQPKGVLCLQAGVCNRVQWMKKRFPLSAMDAVLQKTTFCFDVSVWEIFWPLISGARLVLAKPGGQKDNAYLIELIRKEKITQCQFIPSMLALLLNHHDIGQCTSLKRVFCSGEALSSHMCERFLQQSKAELYNLYGPTEASIEATCFSVTTQNLEHQVQETTNESLQSKNSWTSLKGQGSELLRYHGSDYRDLPSAPIGKPIANVKVYVLDADLNPVPVGVPGELFIGGIGVADGYHQRPELSQQRFLQNPFVTGSNERLYKTGDLVRWLADGNLQYIERLDNQVKIRGYRVELQEIEAAILRHPLVKECVVACQDKAQQLCLIAYMVLSKAHQQITADKMRAYLSGELPDYMTPAFFVTINEIPRNVSGKIDRKNLPHFEENQFNLAHEYALPKSPLEKAIANIWQEVLNRQTIGINDNFFHVGGNSLNALRVLARIYKQFNVELALRSFFDAPTIAQQTAFLATKKVMDKVAYVSPLIAVQRHGTKIPLFLFHPSGGTVFWSIPLVHHLDNHRPVYAFQDPSVELGTLKYPSVELLVAAYLVEMKKVQPHGPYFLAGYSIGATLAIEAGKQLEKQGERVAFLGLIDGWGLYPHEYGDAPQEMQLYKTTMQQLNVLDPDKNSQRTSLEQARRALHAHYRFPVINQHIHLFKANESSALFLGVDDHYNHWQRFAAAGISVYQINGNHETMLLSPNVQQLATFMQRQIDAVEEVEIKGTKHKKLSHSRSHHCEDH